MQPHKKLVLRQHCQKPGFLQSSFVAARKLDKKPGFLGFDASRTLVIGWQLPITNDLCSNAR